MPITFAHPVAVLPFARHLPLTALVAGSIAPDVAYYLPVSLSGSTTHSVAGILWWDLLIGLGLILAFRLSADPAADLFGLTCSPPTASGSLLRAVVTTPAAILLGATTHIVWDSVTQTHGFAVEHWDLLRTSVIEPHKTYNVVGYVSSVGATALLAWLLARRARRSFSAATWSVRPVIVVLLAAPVLGAVLAVDDPITRASTYDLVRYTIIGAAQATACVWTIYAVLWRIGVGRTRSARVTQR